MKLLTLLLIAPAVSFAAPKTKIQFEPEVKLSVRELLSLPGASRLEVAKKRGGEFDKELETLAFSKKEDYTLRWKALTLLAQTRGVKSEKDLQKALKQPEWFMRSAALVAYQEVLPLKAAHVAGDSLNDKALVVRASAVQVLARSEDQQVREKLWDALENPANFRKKQSLFIRGQILAALAKDAKTNEAALFARHLREPDSRLHAPAIIGLERATDRQLGKAKDSVDQKRQLWVKWAKNGLREPAVQSK